MKEQKWRWAGHTARRPENIWIKRLTDWSSRDMRSKGRQDRMWKGETEKLVTKTRQRLAECCDSWMLEETFIRMWTRKGLVMMMNNNNDNYRSVTREIYLLFSVCRAPLLKSLFKLAALLLQSFSSSLEKK